MKINDVVRAALEELIDGPMSIDELTRRLAQRGVLDQWGDLDASMLVAQVDDMLLDTDDTWMTTDGVISSLATMFDSVSFSHRVTDLELSRGELDAAPDLAVLDFGVSSTLHLSSGAALSVHFAPDEDSAGENGFYVGPPGWLDHDGPPTAVLTRRGSLVTLDWDSELGPGGREAAALRREFDDDYSPGVAQEITDLVLNALVRDPSLFRRRVVPISELLASVGLSVEGDWVAVAGEDARPPGVIARERRVAAISERFDFDPCCHKAFEAVLAGWYDEVTETLGKDQLRALARNLHHAAVGPAFAAYVLEGGNGSSPLLEKFARRLTGLSGPLSALGHFLLARNFETDDRGLDMERSLRMAVAADPAYEPALVDLAWCHCDRGDATRALALLARVTNIDVEGEVEKLRAYSRPSMLGVGRNDPCPCGSGRKYKVCCLGAPAAIEDRTDWLLHKIAAFALRPGQGDYLRDLLDTAIDAGGEPVERYFEELFPLIGDVASLDEDGLVGFSLARGPLLPEDERALLSSWIPCSPSLYQVNAVTPQVSVEVIDVRRGETFVVSERLGTASIHPGDYLYARVIRVGAIHQFIGEIVAVPLAHRASLLEALDRGTPWDLANWLGGLFARPHIVNTEHEEIVLCRAVLRLSTGSWPDVFLKLDETFGVSPDHHWSETVEVNGESKVRSFLSLEEDSIVLISNSLERFTRTLERLANDVPELEVHTREVPYIHDTETTPVLPPTPHPALAAALAEFVAAKEIEWLDQPVPALSGLTPREAAGDPTRREDLVALLNEFNRRGPAPAGAATFNVDRLRRELGLSK